MQEFGPLLPPLESAPFASATIVATSRAPASKIEEIRFFQQFRRLLAEIQATLPIHSGWKKLSDQLLVIRLQCRDIWAGGTLAIEVVRVEFPHPTKHFAVVVIHQVVVRQLLMPRIERVVADHV